jgi:hypothetical protein
MHVVGNVSPRMSEPRPSREPSASPDREGDDVGRKRERSPSAAAAVNTAGEEEPDAGAARAAPSQPPAEEEGRLPSELPQSAGKEDSATVETDTGAEGARELGVEAEVETAVDPDEVKDSAYFQHELLLTTTELRVIQRQVSGLKSQLEQERATSAAVNDRCAALEITNAQLLIELEAANAATLHPSTAASSGTGAAASEVTRSAVAVATSRAQLSLVKLESATRDADSLRCQLEAERMHANALKERCGLWRQVASRAVERPTSQRPVTADPAAAATTRTDDSHSGVEEEAKRFHSLLGVSCSILEGKVASDATSGDARAVVGELKTLLLQFVENHKALIKQLAGANRKSAGAHAALAVANDTIGALSADLERVAVPALVFRSAAATAAAQSPNQANAVQQQAGVPAHTMPSASLLSNAIAATAVSRPGAAENDEVRFLRYMLLQQTRRADRLDAAVRSLSTAVDHLVRWASATTPDRDTDLLLALTRINNSAVLGGASAGSGQGAPNTAAAASTDARVRILESVCEQWARRALVSTRLFVDSSLNESANHRDGDLSESHSARAYALLAAERAATSALRRQLLSTVGVASLAAASWSDRVDTDNGGDFASNLREAAADLRAATAEANSSYSAIISTVEAKSAELLRRVQAEYESRELRHMRTVRFLQHSVGLADRAIAELLGRGHEADSVVSLPAVATKVELPAPQGHFEKAAACAQAASSDTTAGIIKTIEDAATRAAQILKAGESEEVARMQRRLAALESMDRTEATRRLLDAETALAAAEARAARACEDAERAMVQANDAAAAEQATLRSEVAEWTDKYQTLKETADEAEQESVRTRATVAELRAKVVEGNAAQAKLRLAQQEVTTLAQTNRSLQEQLEAAATELAELRAAAGDAPDDADNVARAEEEAEQRQDHVQEASLAAVRSIQQATGGAPIGDGFEPTVDPPRDTDLPQLGGSMHQEPADDDGDAVRDAVTDQDHEADEHAARSATRESHPPVDAEEYQEGDEEIEPQDVFLEPADDAAEVEAGNEAELDESDAEIIAEPAEAMVEDSAGGLAGEDITAAADGDQAELSEEQHQQEQAADVGSPEQNGDGDEDAGSPFTSLFV